MRETMHLWPETPREAAGRVRLPAIVEVRGDKRWELAYDVPADQRPVEDDWSDALLVAMVMIAMHEGRDLHLHGRSSASLLENLRAFQAVWHAWKPRRFQVVDLRVDGTREPKARGKGRSVAAFSGGLDSCFTVYRHTLDRDGRRDSPLAACVMVHGFDIPLDDEAGFERALARGRKILGTVDLPLVPVRTNWRERSRRWLDQHGAAAAACLHLFGGRFDRGLIASTYDRGHFTRIGSNPRTDALLSSDQFAMHHDGASYTRMQKVQAVARWPAATEGLRVCWEGSEHDRNCGRCAKCVLTILGFRAQGLPLPACFDRDVDEDRLRDLPIETVAQYAFLEEVFDHASANGREGEAWVRTLGNRLRRARRERSPWAALARRLARAMPLTQGA